MRVARLALVAALLLAAVTAIPVGSAAPECQGALLEWCPRDRCSTLPPVESLPGCFVRLPKPGPLAA